MSRAIVPGRRRLVRAAALPLAHRAGLAPVAAAPFAPLPVASVPLAAVLAGANGALVPAALAATPACVDPSEPTPPQTAGPFYSPGSPRRASLIEPGMAGTRLRLSGRVLATDCRPLPQALLEFWQADAAGRYDNQGYRLRGHLLTDDEGRWTLDTIVPGAYPGRTRHIHVRVRAERGPLLTTQLYFPGEPGNRRDGLFAPALLVAMTAGDLRAGSGGDGGSPVAASFDFVLPG